MAGKPAPHALTERHEQGEAAHFTGQIVWATGLD